MVHIDGIWDILERAFIEEIIYISVQYDIGIAHMSFKNSGWLT